MYEPEYYYYIIKVSVTNACLNITVRSNNASCMNMNNKVEVTCPNA